MQFKFSYIIICFYFTVFSFSVPAIEIENINLPDMGDSSGTLISPAQEKELGDAFFRSLHSRIKINQDAEIQEYIQSIGRQLVTNSDLPSSPFHFFIVLDNQINAFAGPGGYIGVNSGLLLLTESESELASVLAHEIAHITQRHLYRAFEAASRLSIPTAAATLAAILLGTQSPELGQAALIAIQAGSVQFQIDFTRDNEKEADRVGMQTLSKSSYNPKSMPVFFERLQQSTRYYGQNIPEFLRTHPVSASRISDTRGRANKYSYKHYPDSLGYLLAKAKLRVLTTTNLEDTLKHFRAREHLGTTEQQAIALYGIGLVNLQLLKYSEADAIFKQLIKKYPNQPQYIFAEAKNTFLAQKYKQALKMYEKAIDQFPTNVALKLEYISTLLKTGNPGSAKQLLQSLNYQTKKLPIYFELLAQTYANLKQSAESHRYLAEYYYSVGHTKTAILQIKLAQKVNGSNYYLQAILDERLSFFVEEENNRKLDL